MDANAITKALTDHGVTDKTNVEQWKERLYELQFNNGGVLRLYPISESHDLLKVDFTTQTITFRELREGHAVECVTDFENLQIMTFKSNFKFTDLQNQHQFHKYDKATGRDLGIDENFKFTT